MKGYKKFILLIAIILFTTLTCGLLSRHHGWRIRNDPIGQFFIKKEIKSIGDDGIFPRSKYRRGFYDYAKIYYDFNRDKKADVIEYHCVIRGEFDLTVHTHEWIWQKEWFKKDIDTDYDGKFDLFLEENKDGGIEVISNLRESWLDKNAEKIEFFVVTTIPFMVSIYALIGISERKKRED